MKSIYLSLTLFAAAAGIYLLLDGVGVGFGNIFSCSIFLAVAILWAVEGLGLKIQKNTKDTSWDSNGLSQ